MGIRDNFSQAVKDLLKRDNLVGEDPVESEDIRTELDRYMEASAQPEAINSAAAEGAEHPLETPYYPSAQATAGNQATDSAQQGQDTQQTYGFSASAPQAYTNPLDTDVEMTVISRNTIIEGNVRSFANMNVQGNVKGNVETTKNVEMSGKVVGDIACNNITMSGSSMQGNIGSKGQVAMDKDTLLLGDVAAQYCDINGKIKGNIQIGGKAELRSEAVVFGDINASAITVLDGAIIQGYINTTYLKEDTGKIFPDAIAVGE